MDACIRSSGYGKSRIRIMRVIRDDYWHSIWELMLSVELQLRSNSEYTDENNSVVITTDSMKNTVYLLAKGINV